ncbi:MAG: hypothetical protein JWL84_156 [Rhodospirillales bacterium]|nr:hypothetical protein [Rhodospirillales bacterium]
MVLKKPFSGFRQPILLLLSGPVRRGGCDG